MSLLTYARHLHVFEIEEDSSGDVNTAEVEGRKEEWEAEMSEAGLAGAHNARGLVSRVTDYVTKWGGLKV